MLEMNVHVGIDQVNNDDDSPLEIASDRGDAVPMPRANDDVLDEPAYLLRVPSNSAWLRESLEQARDGDRHQHDLL
jgi:antitoxin YefM